MLSGFCAEAELDVKTTAETARSDVTRNLFIGDLSRTRWIEGWIELGWIETTRRGKCGLRHPLTAPLNTPVFAKSTLIACRK